MAKFSIEVELDWVDEDSTIDQAVRDAIENKIVDKISKQIAEEVKAEQSKRFKDQISDRVDDLVNDTFEALLSLQVVQTDAYGDAKQTFPSVREMIKSRFDSYISESVNSENGGKYDGYGRGGKVTRFEYIMGKAFGQELDKKMAELKVKVEKDTATATAAMFAKMQEILEDSVKSQLGDKVAELIKLDDILKLTSGKK
jgi:hypothetical protein